MANLSRKFKALTASVILVSAATLANLSLTGCGGDSGGSKITNDNGGGDDDPIINPEGRIVLSNAFNAVAPAISPVEINQTTMTYGQAGASTYYSETFNTVFFEANQFENGKKYIFNGEVDGTGKVVDRIVIRSVPGVDLTNIDITINNAQLTFGRFYGDTKITLDVPCFNQRLDANGVVLAKWSPKPPFDKAPVVEGTSLSAETIIYAPGYAKKRIGGGAPTTI